MMTWPEVKAAMAAGKTTALFYTGGTEQRGPQNVNGGHTLMGRETVKAIALRLGNAIAMPVLPYTPNNASADAARHDRADAGDARRDSRARQPSRRSRPASRTSSSWAITAAGSRTIYGDVAKKLDAKYAPQGMHVYFCDEVYAKAQGDFDKWLAANGYPISSHAGIPDTSEMLYLGGDLWMRKELIPTAVGDPVPRGATRDPNAPRVNNGITGDARRSSPELGKRAFDMKVDYAVKQIRGFLGMK